MKHEKGSTLVVSLVMLTIITLVAVYMLEGSNIQSKMVANSIFGTLTFEECRNEQEAHVRFMNINGGTNRSVLINSIPTAALLSYNSLTKDTSDRTDNLPRSESIITTWQYQKEQPASTGGYDLDIESQIKNHIFDNVCVSNFRFASDSQTLGATVQGLEQAGSIN